MSVRQDLHGRVLASQFPLRRWWRATLYLKVLIMLINFNLQSLARHLSEALRHFGERKKPLRRRPRVAGVEVLETRDMLTTFTVTTLNDVVNAGDGVTSLREALTAANANAGGDTIEFAANLNGTISLASGLLQINDPVTIQGNGAENTIVDAHQASRVFRLSPTAGAVTFDSLTITGGRTTGNDYLAGGAGIFSNSSGTLTITNSVITGNVTTGSGTFTHTPSGGAISFTQPVTVNITNSTISNNSTIGAYASGGAIYGFGGGTLTLTNTSVTGNTTSGPQANGGAIYWSSGEVNLIGYGTQVRYNSTYGANSRGGAIFSKNAALNVVGAVVIANSTQGEGARGGGLYSEGGNIALSDNAFVSYNATAGSAATGGGMGTSSGSVTVTGSTVSNNSTAGFDASGGGIFTSTGPVTIVNSRITGNATAGDNAAGGGGLYVDSADVSIHSSEISGNSTQGSHGYGGGIRVRSGALTIVNSTISGNQALGASTAGGGVSIDFGSLLMTNCTVTANVSVTQGFVGGGVFAFEATVTIDNSIIAGNFNAGAPDLGPGSGALAVHSSLIGSNQGTALTASAAPDANGNLIGTIGAPLNPVLGPLQYNGGFTQTHALLASPAINAGSNSLASAAGVGVLDQRGLPRTDGFSIDMGAYEFQTPFATFSVASIAVSEENNPILQVTVDLSSPSALPVFIPFTVGGDANNPTDYTIAASPLLIPPGQTSGTIQINIVATVAFETTESIVLTFGNLINAFAGPITSTTVTILDVDVPPVATFSTATQSISENVGIVAVTVDLSFAIAQNVTIPFTVTGSAGSPGDFTLAASPLVIPAGQTSGTFNLTVVNDALIEGDETVIVTLGTPTNATLGATAVKTFTINDDDFAPVASFNLASQTVNESAGTATLTVNLSAPAQTNVTIPFTLSGTALPADYSASASPLVILAGSSSGAITLSLVDDALIEGSENVVVTLGTPTNATLGTTVVHTVTIADNDNNSAPVIPAGQSFLIAENSSIGQVVGSVVANDADTTAPFNVLTFSLTSNPNNTFAINPANGQLTVANGSALDFEVSGSFNIGIAVTDGGNLTANQTVSITVTNVNEAPSIPANQTFFIPENSSVGANVGTVVANDPDSAPPFGTKNFTLTSNPSGAFAINATTGQITIANGSVLNFETTPQFVVGVSVSDGGSPALTASQNVTISLMDVNEAPVIAANQTLNVAENAAPGVVVGTVTASDPDGAAPNNSRTFSIAGGNTGNAFAINPATGQVTVATSAALNFETTTQFLISVTVTDGGNPALSVSQNVAINLSDVNEAPLITAGQTFIIVENAGQGSVVGTVAASDPDGTAPNNTKSFSISGGNIGNAFSLNASSGQITVNSSSAVDFESNPFFNLNVTVTDGGGLNATQSVAVSVTNVNEAPVLGGPGAAPTFVFKSKTPVAVLPSITVADPDGSTNLASVTINVTLPASKKKLDVINAAGLNSLGSVSGSFASGGVVISLNIGVTASQVESVLRSITFSSKGASLKTPTRTFQVSVTDRSGTVSNVINQTVSVRKK